MNTPSVLHFIETGIPGGAESMLIDLCRRQQRTGIRVAICHFDHPFFAEQCARYGIEQISAPPRRLFKRTRTLPAFGMQFAKIIRRNGIHLLHSHLFGPIVGGALAAFFARVPHVGTLHDVHMIEESPRRSLQIDLALLLGSRLAAVSEQMGSYYRKRAMLYRNRIICIRNGIDAPAGAAISRTELGISPDHVLAICVGRLVPLKRVHDALHALALARQHVPISLLVVGDGPELPKLRALALELELAEHVRFLGSRGDVAALLSACDLFIQCSETEGLSMSIIEALHAGLPCIVTNVGGNPELIQHEWNGVLVPIGDTREMAERMINLALSPQSRGLMGDRSRRIALEHFDGDACAAKYLDLYRRLGLCAQPDSQTFSSQVQK